MGDIIEGNDSKVSFGGQFLSTGMYKLVNQTSKVEGGPFTLYEPSDPKCHSKKSCY